MDVVLLNVVSSISDEAIEHFSKRFVSKLSKHIDTVRSFLIPRSHKPRSFENTALRRSPSTFKILFDSNLDVAGSSFEHRAYDRMLGGKTIPPTSIFRQHYLFRRIYIDLSRTNIYIPVMYLPPTSIFRRMPGANLSSANITSLLLLLLWSET